MGSRGGLPAAFIQALGKGLVTPLIHSHEQNARLLKFYSILLQLYSVQLEGLQQHMLQP